MSFVQVAATYLAANILILFSFCLVVGMAGIFTYLKSRLTCKVELNLHYFTIAVVVALICLHPFLPKKDIFKPVAKVWAAQSGKSFVSEYFDPTSQGYVSISTSSPKMFAISMASRAVSVFAILLVVVGIFKLLTDLGRLLRLRSRSYRVRKINGLRIYVSEEIQVPFSFWIPGQKNIVMPESLLGRNDYRIAILHEIHHHRQGDTKWVYLIWFLRVTFVLNPIIHLWSRWLSEIQEFACDEALVGQQKVDSQEYASCLIRVAESALKKESQPLCATGLTFLADRKTLKRRIEFMLEKNKVRFGWKTALPIGAAVAAILSGTAFASQGFVQDRRITMVQAESMAKVVQKDGSFPIVVNDRVLKWLNYFIGTPEGREQVKEALIRMENYRSMIDRKLSKYQLPSELLAVPLIESGYKNLDAIENPAKAAGLWQFIASTAVNFGLNVLRRSFQFGLFIF